jgi:hypothetical protein
MNQQENGQFTVYPTAADVPRYQRDWVWGLAALGILSCGILAGGLLGATLAPSATGPYAGPVAMHPTAAQLRARIEQLEQALRGDPCDPVNLRMLQPGAEYWR